MMRWRATQLLRSRAAITSQPSSANSTMAKAFTAEDVTNYVADGLGAQGRSFFGSFRHFGGPWSLASERGDLVKAPNQLGQREQGTLTDRNQKTLVLHNVPGEISSEKGHSNGGVDGHSDGCARQASGAGFAGTGWPRVRRNWLAQELTGSATDLVRAHPLPQ